MDMAIGQSRSIPDLFGDLVLQATALIRTEARLARTEMSENISRAGVGIGCLIAGAVLLIPALVILLQAAVNALITTDLTPAQAAGIVGGIALVIGLILAFVGMRQLRPASLMPSKTINQLQNDAAIAREQARNDNDIQRAA